MDQVIKTAIFITLHSEDNTECIILGHNMLLCKYIVCVVLLCAWEMKSYFTCKEYIVGGEIETHKYTTQFFNTYSGDGEKAPQTPQTMIPGISNIPSLGIKIMSI